MSQTETPMMETRTCPFRKGEVLEFTSAKTGKVIVGKMVGISRDGRKITILAGDTKYTWGWQHFSQTNKKLVITNPYRVGDRVEWEPEKGVIRSGAIRSIREERITVIRDDNNMATCSGHYSLFRPTTRLAPEPAKRELLRTDPPMALDAFTVTGFRATPVTDAFEGHEGNGYTATLRYNGKIVGKLYNEGVGGCGSLNAPRGVEALLKQCLSDAWEINGGKKADVPGADNLMDLWAYWAGVKKKHGKFFWEVVKEMQDFCDAHPRPGKE